MADDTHSPTTPTGDPITNPETQLQYPQLLLEASFASLLSNSQTSQATQPHTEVTMPRSEVSLSESWSSLSERDLIHEDDDLYSNATDTGSLIDANNTGDVHSVDEYGHSSDTDSSGDAEEEQDDMDMSGAGLRDSYNPHVHQSHYAQTYSQESIRLEDSTVIVDASGQTSLQASKTFTDVGPLLVASSQSTDTISDRIVGTIRMSLSPESLTLGQNPYHILYYGSPLSSPEIKSDVLGKIGAALISPGEAYQHNDSSDSPCFHVVPSEFGPGSRPATADLIPIPTQMHITECVVPKVLPTNTSDSSIELILNNGKHVTSRRHGCFESPTNHHWNLPDLAVVVVSQNESQDGRAKAQQVIDFARRHHVAVLCLRQEAGWDGDDFLAETDAHMLHKYVESMQGENGHKMLLDVDAFLTLDTEQINQHLNYLSSAAVALRRQSGSLGNIWRGLGQHGCRQFFEVLGLVRPGWEIQISSPDVLTARQTKEKEMIQIMSSAHKSQRKAQISNLMSHAATMLVPLAATLITLYACQMLVPYLMSFTVPKIPSLPAGGIVRAPCLAHTAPTVATTMAPTQSSALSSRLLADNQQVQKYLPQEILSTRSCQKITPGHMARSLVVNPKWFESGEAKFRVHVVRGDEVVKAAVEKQNSDVLRVLVKREDMYGELTVHLDGREGYVCGTIDFRNSMDEALTDWLKSLHQTWPGRKTATRAINTYRQLVDIRAPNAGLVGNALSITHSATQKLGAAMEAVEKSAVRQARLCHQGKDGCFMNSIGQLKKDITDSAQQVRRISENMMHKARSQVVDSTKQARDRVNGVNAQVQEEISKAMQMVQTSVEEVSNFAKVYSGQMKDRLGEAQQRAHKLVKKPQSHRTKGRCTKGRRN